MRDVQPSEYKRYGVDIQPDNGSSKSEIKSSKFKHKLEVFWRAVDYVPKSNKSNRSSYKNIGGMFPFKQKL